MHKLMLAIGATDVPIQDIVAGETFTLYDGEFTSSEQSVIVSIDVTPCTGTYENVISIGSDISTWNGTANLHVYYTASSRELELDICSSNTHVKTSITIDSNALTDVVIKVTKDGIYVNNTTVTYSSGLTSWLSLFNSLTSIQIGSAEGSTRSNATYNYIKIIRNI